MLDSAKYWSVTVEARQLFVHLMLLADDFGLVSLAPVFIRRRCFDDAPAPAKIDKLLEQLQDADLIRIYDVGNVASAARYAFIPKFGQRLRQMRARHPKPPAELYSDDEAATNLFRGHGHLFEKSSANWRRIADKSRPEVETKGNDDEGEGRGRGTRLPADFKISENVRAWALKRGYEPYLQAHFEYFVLDAQSRSNARYVDWDKALMKAIAADWGGVRKQDQMAARHGGQTMGAAARVVEWWETKVGLDAKAKELGVEHVDDPRRVPAENLMWLRAKVAAAMGDGPWCERSETFERLLQRARELREGTNA